MAATLTADRPGRSYTGNVLVTGWCMNYPSSVAANIQYPMVCHAQPNVGPNSTFSQYGYFYVAPFPGKVISLGIVGVSTPGRANGAFLATLLKNGTAVGNTTNTNSFSAKSGVINNLSFSAGDTLGITFAIPVAGAGVVTGSLLLQFTLPS